MYFALCVVSVYLSRSLPGSVLRGPILSLGSWSVMLKLPLFWLLPAMALCMALFRLYNVRYTMTSKGLESRVGVLWTSQHISRVRFEDIVGIETRQTLLERFLNVGDIEIGTAATGGIELVFEGVASPFEVMKIIQSERDQVRTVQGKAGSESRPSVNRNAVPVH